MKICGIYKITNPKGRVYIGQSIDINRRFMEYKILNCKNQCRLYNSLTKHGWDNHIFEVIEECSVEKLNERERYWQDYYNVIGENGLNLVLTKFNSNSGYFSNETRIKMSKSKIGNKSRLGNKHSDDTKNKISLGNKGKKRSKHVIENIRQKQKGKVLSKEHKEKISNSMRGKKFKISSALTAKKSKYATERFSKKVLDLNTGIIYSSAKEYSIENNLNYNKVRNILAGHIKNIYNIKRYE